MPEENLVFFTPLYDYPQYTYCREIMLNTIFSELKTQKINEIFKFGYTNMYLTNKEIEVFKKNINYLYNIKTRFTRNYELTYFIYAINEDCLLTKHLISSMMYMLKVDIIRNYLISNDITDKSVDYSLYKIFYLINKYSILPDSDSIKKQLQYNIIYIKYRQLVMNAINEFEGCYYNGCETYMKEILIRSQKEFKDKCVDYIQKFIVRFNKNNPEIYVSNQPYNYINRRCY